MSISFRCASVSIFPITHTSNIGDHLHQRLHKEALKHITDKDGLPVVGKQLSQYRLVGNTENRELWKRHSPPLNKRRTPGNAMKPKEDILYSEVNFCPLDKVC